MIHEQRPRVLCVDDEPQVLEGLSLTLGRHYAVTTATSGKSGLELLERAEPFHVVLSDMRMPGLDGAAFLGWVRMTTPDSVRMLLTGHADIEAAIAAVNEGQIFRFLTKPCPPTQLLSAVEAAVEQHELVTAQRVLLEHTLHGCIRALMDVLALANPQAFSRAMRIKSHVEAMTRPLGLQELWAVEIAAMLSQIGCVTLPPRTVEKLSTGEDLSREERDLVAHLPILADQLLAGIPRIDTVRRVLARYSRPRPQGATSTEDADVGGEALRIAVDFDYLEARGLSDGEAIGILRNRDGSYDPSLLEALARLRGQAPAQGAHEVALNAVRVGMVVADDVRLKNGTLLVGRGYQVTPGFVERVRNFPRGAVREPIRVLLPDP